MEFTEAIPAFGGRALLSPNGRYLARLTPGSDFVLLIQETGSLGVLLSTAVPLLMDNEAAAGMAKSRHFPPPKPRRVLPQDLDLRWSPDSSKMLIFDGPVNRVFIYDLQDQEAGGLVLQETLPTARFLWAPDSAHVLSVLDHRIGVRVWSLQSRYPIKAITNIKSSSSGIDFCPEGNMMAILHRKEGLDFIAIYNCRTWSPIQVRLYCISFDLTSLQVLRPPEASLLEEVRFGRGDFSRNHIAERPLLYAWEMPCLSSRLFIFETDGACKVVDVHCGAEGVQESFGFMDMVTSPSSDIAALIGHDGSIVLWNVLLQKPVTKFTVSAELTKLPHLIAFKERIVYGEDSKFVKYESGYDLMLNELASRPSAQAPATSVQAKFSFDSKLMAIHSCIHHPFNTFKPSCVALFPNHLWIYSVLDMTFMAVLCQLPSSPTGSIKSFDWHPQQNILGLVTGSDYVYFWQPEGCHCIPQPYTDPEERCSRTFEWNPRVESGLMLLAGGNSCCLAMPDFAMSA